MTNNNWINEFDNKFSTKMLGEYISEDILHNKQIKDFISNLLAKKDQEHQNDLSLLIKGCRESLLNKDQEHKAELEKIKGEIKSKIRGKYAIEDCAFEDTIYILDTHINNHINQQDE